MIQWRATAFEKYQQGAGCSCLLCRLSVTRDRRPLHCDSRILKHLPGYAGTGVYSSPTGLFPANSDPSPRNLPGSDSHAGGDRQASRPSIPIEFDSVRHAQALCRLGSPPPMVSPSAWAKFGCPKTARQDVQIEEKRPSPRPQAAWHGWHGSQDGGIQPDHGSWKPDLRLTLFVRHRLYHRAPHRSLCSTTLSTRRRRPVSSSWKTAGRAHPIPPS